jgi:hypothetical protein
MRILYSFLACLLLSAPALAQNYTFNDVAPIIYQHCMTCHRPGEVGPFSLITYADVSSQANAIKIAVNNRVMPPWSAKPNPAATALRGERILNAQELAILNSWVDNGAPEGDPNLAPTPPVFPTGSAVGIPDLVVKMNQNYVVPTLTSSADKYRTFVLPTGLTENKEVRAIEFRPGNTRIVHHSLLNQDTTNAGRNADAADPGYGYDDISFNNFSAANGLGGWAPGGAVQIFPEGIGKVLYKNADILMQIHYPYYGSNDSDASEVNIFYAQSPIQRKVKGYPLVYSEVVGNSNYPDAQGKPSCVSGNTTYTATPGPALIQAQSPVPIPANILQTLADRSCYKLLPNLVTTIVAKKTIPEEFSLIGITPHMHLLGISSRSYAITPTNDTIFLSDVPKWDFRWQDEYFFQKFIRIPQNSVLVHEATYDNTSSNPNQVNNPPKTVYWEENTTSEMIMCTFSGVPYQAGDELLNTTAVDEDLKANRIQLQAPYPNPVVIGQDVRMELALNKTAPLTVILYDINGNEVRRLYNSVPFYRGVHELTISTNGLTEGIYLLRMTAGELSQTTKLLVRGQ